MLQIPMPICRLLDKLLADGYEAYVVGGCIRDSLLGFPPKDWDIATSALPEETKRVFEGFRLVETGFRHGTLTVFADAQTPVEITTYRIDGAYSDNRHPDHVFFTKELNQDLARRDFTINALAYRPGTGIIDPFGGKNDLFRHMIRCVGLPEHRFKEDSLRILRALRFSSVLGFSIDTDTALAIHSLHPLLTNIAAERIATELLKILCGDAVFEVLMAYPDVIAQILPELRPMQGFAQNNPYHIYDVYEHTARTVQSVPADPVVRLAMLLHDSGKPSCYTQDGRGIGHFRGHPAVSTSIAQAVLMRLRIETNTIKQVCTLITYHDTDLAPTVPCMKRWLNRLGEDMMRKLLVMKAADIRAQSPERMDRLNQINQLTEIVDQIISTKQCFTLHDLEVNGHDLAALGLFPGKKMGDTLDALLEAVMDGRCPNEREALLEYVGTLGV